MTGSPLLTAAVMAAGAVVVGLGALLSVHFGRRARTVGDWLTARGSLPLPVVAVTQFASAAGGGVLVAHVGIAYAHGWSVFVYEFCVAAGLMLLAVIAPWLRSQDFRTLPDVLSRIYGSHRGLVTVGGIATLALPIGWVCTQFGAFAALFSELTGYPKTVLVGLVLVGTVAFVLPGGFTSVAWTDFVFGIVKIVLALGIGAYCVSVVGGWGVVADRLPELAAPSSIGHAGSERSWLWVAAIIPSTLSNQIYFQRVFATRDLRRARAGLVLGGATMGFAGIYALLIGLAVRVMNPRLDPEAAAGWLLTQLPPAVLVLFGAFLVAVIVSASAAALQSSVTTAVADLKQKVLRRPGTDRSNLVASRVATVVIALLAGCVALYFPSVLGWMVALYAYSASVLTVPVFAGYALSRRYALGRGVALSAMVCGLVGCGAAQIAGTTVPYVVHGLGSSLAGLLVAFLLQQVRTHRRGAPEQEAQRFAVAEE